MKKNARIYCISLALVVALTFLFACSTGTQGGDDPGPGPAPTPHAITVIPTGATGSEKVTANVTEAAAGTTITLKASLGANRRVALSANGVVITPSTISTNGDTATFTMPDAAVAITAAISDIPSTLYPITVTQSGATGSEKVTANVTEATEGTTITLTAILGANRRVALSANGVVINPSTISVNNGTATFTMPGNAVAITATISDIPSTLYPITVTQRGSTGSEQVAANVTEAAAGTTITLTAALDSDRQVALSVGGIVINPSTISVNNGTATFTMPGNAVSITATFKSVYPLTITSIGATGSEVVTASVTKAVQGTLITLTATLGTDRRVTFSAIDQGIRPVTISTNNGTTTLLMPDSALEVRACFFTALTHSANSKQYNMHFVPSGGPFTMGEHLYSTTKQVTLTNDFWMSETEVTQGLWEAVWGTTWPNTAPQQYYGAGGNHPAYNMRWYDAVAFCNLLTMADSSIDDSEQVYYSDAELSTAYTKVNAAAFGTVYVDWSKKGYRLPTEAEWEYAARYIDGTSWTHGNHVSGDIDYVCYDNDTCSHTFLSNFHIDEYAWWFENNGGAGSYAYGVKQVGSKIANALGLRDMSGNVYEWCHDLYGEYTGGSETDPTGPASGSYRVVRGGDAYMQRDCLCCSYRDYYFSLEGWSNNLGFRLCRTAD